jgi:hypothetical protein
VSYDDIPIGLASIRCHIGNIGVHRKYFCSTKVGGCNKEEFEGPCRFYKLHSSYVLAYLREVRESSN